MKYRKLNISDYLIIVANLIPVYGVWFEGWSASQIFLVFCLETVIIGVFNVLKMACVTLFARDGAAGILPNKKSTLVGLFLIVFFIMHYGIFVFVQTQLFFGVSGIIDDNSIMGAYRQIPEALGKDGQLVLLIFIIYYTLYNLFNFFFSGEYKTISLLTLLFQPYGRIFIQQFVVILGSLFLSMGFDKIFILIMVVIKVFVELYLNFTMYQGKFEPIIKKMKERKDNYPKS